MKTTTKNQPSTGKDKAKTKIIKIKRYLHDESECCAEVTKEIAQKLGYEEDSPEYDHIYSKIYCHELELTLELTITKTPFQCKTKIIKARNT